jgi:serralysin
MKCFAFSVGFAALLFTLLNAANSAQAAFHLWKFDEVFSNTDGSVQFIELVDGSNFESSVGGQQLKSNGNTITVPTNLPSSITSNHHMLFATAGFAALPGGVTPDYIIPAHFFSPASDSLSWASGFDLQSITTIPTNGFDARLLPGSGTATNSPTNFAGTSGSVNLTPEPSTLALACVGILLIALRRYAR